MRIHRRVHPQCEPVDAPLGMCRRIREGSVRPGREGVLVGPLSDAQGMRTSSAVKQEAPAPPALPALPAPLATGRQPPWRAAFDCPKSYISRHHWSVARIESEHLSSSHECADIRHASNIRSHQAEPVPTGFRMHSTKWPAP